MADLQQYFGIFATPVGGYAWGGAAHSGFFWSYVKDDGQGNLNRVTEIWQAEPANQPSIFAVISPNNSVPEGPVPYDSSQVFGSITAQHTHLPPGLVDVNGPILSQGAWIVSSFGPGSDYSAKAAQIQNLTDWVNTAGIPYQWEKLDSNSFTMTGAVMTVLPWNPPTAAFSCGFINPEWLRYKNNSTMVGYLQMSYTDFQWPTMRNPGPANPWWFPGAEYLLPGYAEGTQALARAATVGTIDATQLIPDFSTAGAPGIDVTQSILGLPAFRSQERSM
jgi:hypothetical protein